MMLCTSRSTLFPYTTLFRSFFCKPVRWRALSDVLQVLYREGLGRALQGNQRRVRCAANQGIVPDQGGAAHVEEKDRKSTRLNSSHTVISYAVFCLKKKNIQK